MKPLIIFPTFTERVLPWVFTHYRCYHSFQQDYHPHLLNHESFFIPLQPGFQFYHMKKLVLTRFLEVALLLNPVDTLFKALSLVVKSVDYVLLIELFSWLLEHYTLIWSVFLVILADFLFLKQPLHLLAPNPSILSQVILSNLLALKATFVFNHLLF